MCSTKLKLFSALLVLSFLLCFSPLLSSLYAETVLTESEVQEILNEITESRKELNQAKEELTQSKKNQQNVMKESQMLKTELQDVKNTYEKQKKSYEMQLSEEQKKNEKLKTGITITGTSSAIFLVLMVVFIFI